MLRTIQVVPTLVTIGNLLAGVLALAWIADAAAAGEATRDALWTRAGWVIFVGMVCDGLDGRIARLTRSTSPFGAQLDSLADIVTFGVAPAMLAKAVLAASFPMVSGRLFLVLTVAYVVGAAMRLARYNVESARVSEAAAHHVTLIFRGLPSPAAAGVVASLVLLRAGYPSALPAWDWALLLAAPLLGGLMVSRFPYPHLINRFVEGRRGIPAIVLIAVTVVLVVTHLLETVAVGFFLYAASGPVIHGVARLTDRPRWAVREEEDEATLAEEEAEEGEPSEPLEGAGGGRHPDPRGRRMHPS